MQVKSRGVFFIIIRSFGFNVSRIFMVGSSDAGEVQERLFYNHMVIWF